MAEAFNQALTAAESRVRMMVWAFAADREPSIKASLRAAASRRALASALPPFPFAEAAHG